MAGSVDSDWLLANGDPNDLNIVNPTNANWLAAINPAYLIGGQPGQRILNNAQTDAGLFNYNWGWFSEGFGTGDTLRTRQFNAVDGANITFRIYEREADPVNQLIDVIVWSTDLQYVPTNADYFNARVPEPSTLTITAIGALCATAFVLRRRAFAGSQAGR